MLNFRAKTIVGIALIEIVMLVVLVASALKFLGDSNERQLTQRTHATATMFAHAVTDAVISTDLATLDDLVYEIMQLEDVVYANVVRQGQVLATGGDTSLIAISKQQSSDIESARDILDTIVDIEVNGISYGQVELGFTTTTIRNLLNQARRSIIGIATLEVLLVALFSFVLGTYLTRNLLRLRDAAKTVKKVGPGFQLNLNQSDEIGEVASAFDSMSKSLQDNYRELEMAREESDHANQSKSRFLASMSHEIRTPMNGVLGLITALKQTPLNDEQLKLIDTAQDSGHLMLALINNILDFSRMEANNLNIEHKAFDLKQATDTVLNSMQPLAQQSAISLTSVMNDVPSYVLGSHNHYKQILLNLVGNALKFTSQGKVTVVLKTKQTDGQRIILECKVKDTGIGIKADDLPYLFDEFTMADASFTRTHEGSGLGLAICQRLINMMDGEIHVDSIEGVGSCFTFTIPLQLATEEEFNHQNQSPAALTPRCKGARVLVAEDNKANQMVILNLFKHISPHTDIAENGIEALTMVKENDYDIIFMDISMPKMDGITACKAIRNLACPHKAAIPIIAFTAHALTGDKEKFLKAGMSDYLSKPVSLAKLIDKLNKHMTCCDEHDTITELSIELPPVSDEPQISDTFGDKSLEPSIIDSATGEPLLNEQTLQQIIKDTSADALPMLIDHYVEETRVHQTKIRLMTEQASLEKLRFEAHKMISSSMALGNSALSVMARNIEIECNNNNESQAYQLAEQLDDLSTRSIEALLARKQQGFTDI